jgi:hypothetical protein
MMGLIKDLAQQIWTFVGLFSAWLVLTGSAKTVVGYAIMISVFLWITTYPIRRDKEEKE